MIAGTRAAVPQVKVDRVAILQNVSCCEPEDGKRRCFDLLFVGGDKLLHRTSVLYGDDQGNDGDEDRRPSEDDIDPPKSGVVGV